MRIFVEGKPEEQPEEIAALIHQLLQLANVQVTLRAPPYYGIQHSARVARKLENPISVEHFVVTKGNGNDS